MRARSVRSVANRLSASCLPIGAGDIASLASPGAALPSLAVSLSSGEPATIFGSCSARSSGLIASNCFEMARSTLRSDGVLTRPTIR